MRVGAACRRGDFRGAAAGAGAACHTAGWPWAAATAPRHRRRRCGTAPAPSGATPRASLGVSAAVDVAAPPAVPAVQGCRCSGGAGEQQRRRPCCLSASPVPSLMARVLAIPRRPFFRAPRPQTARTRRAKRVITKKCMEFVEGNSWGESLLLKLSPNSNEQSLH